MENVTYQPIYEGFLGTENITNMNSKFTHPTFKVSKTCPKDSYGGKLGG